jgi:hypothetical protein
VSGEFEISMAVPVPPAEHPADGERRHRNRPEDEDERDCDPDPFHGTTSFRARRLAYQRVPRIGGNPHADCADSLIDG